MRKHICSLLHTANMNNSTPERKILMRKKQAAVTRPKTVSVLDYLRTASPTLLHRFELERLNRAANLRKDLQYVLDQILQVTAEAHLAHILIEHRKQLLARGNPTPISSAADLLADIAGRVPRMLEIDPIGKKP